MVRILKQVKFENFRQYLEADVSFKVEGNKRLAILFGTNDDGKTNFLNAIKYCLYGEVVIPSSKGGLEKPFITNLNHPNKETNVSITLYDEETKKQIKITRKNERVSVYEGPKLLDEEKVIRGLLPQSVMDLFLFEGEKTKTNISGSLKSTIENVSGLDRINIAKKLLENLDSVYLKRLLDLNKNTNKKTKLIESIDQLKRKNQIAKENLENIKIKIDKYTLDLNGVNEELDKVSEKTVRELRGKSNLYSQLIKEESDSILKLENDLKKMFVESFSPWLISSTGKIYEELISRLTKENLMPPAFESKDISKLIKSEFCICGNSIKKKELACLSEIIERNKKAPEKYHQLKDVARYSEFNKVDFDNLKKSFGENLKSLSELRVKLTENQKKFNAVEEQLKLIDEESISTLVTQRSDLMDRISDLNTDLIQTQTDVKTVYEPAILGEKKALEALPSESKEEDEIKAHQDEMKNIIDKLDKIYQHFIELIRKNLLNKMDETFKKIFSKTTKKEYFTFEFNDNFEIKILNDSGDDLTMILGTGVKKSIGISLMIALSEIYGFDFPIIFDAPFTELDKPQKKELLDVLIDTSKEKQVILLIMKEDKEDQEIYSKLKSNASTIYNINNNDRNIAVMEEIKCQK